MVTVESATVQITRQEVRPRLLKTTVVLSEQTDTCINIKQEHKLSYNDCINKFKTNATNYLYIRQFDNSIYI